MEKKPKFLRINDFTIINTDKLLSCRVSDSSFFKDEKGFCVTLKIDGHDLEILFKTHEETKTFVDIISENIGVTQYSSKTCEICLP